LKYALLIYPHPDGLRDLSEAERQSVSEEYMAIGREPDCVEGGHLQPVHTATTVRSENGRLLTTDGPFADTKEAFAGYYILDAGDLDRALEVAGRIPAVRLGGAVEVRPLV
jgi:hypothetical protein